MLITTAVTQSKTSTLNLDAPRHMADMSITTAVFQLDISRLTSVAP